MCTCTFRNTNLNSQISTLFQSCPACPYHVAGHSSILHRISWQLANPINVAKYLTVWNLSPQQHLHIPALMELSWLLWKGKNKTDPLLGETILKRNPWASNLSCNIRARSKAGILLTQIQLKLCRGKGVQCWLHKSLLLLVIVGWIGMTHGAHGQSWSHIYIYIIIYNYMRVCIYIYKSSPCLPSGQVKTPWPFRWNHFLLVFSMEVPFAVPQLLLAAECLPKFHVWSHSDLCHASHPRRNHLSRNAQDQPVSSLSMLRIRAFTRISKVAIM